jgi:KDO2-lipid IV(A) lauroyltransferase
MEKTRRRELRARVLRALALVPAPVVRVMLSGALPLARFTRYERRIADNLELALGGETTPAQRRRITRGVLRHSARIFSEWLKLARGGDGAWIDSAVALDPSIAILRREMERGRGVLVVTAHLGNWELLCARLRRLGLEGAVIGYERPGDPSSAWLARMRRAYGVETLPQATSPREVLRVLQGGRVVGLLADLEDRRVDGEFLPFFGTPALTMTAPAALSRAAKVPLLPVRCVAVPGGGYRLSVEEPLALDPVLPRREATVELSLRLNRTFEGWIREAPEQWAWHQARWRTRPALIHS